MASFCHRLVFPVWDSRRCLRALSRAWVDGVLPAGPPVGRASLRCYLRVRHRNSGVRREQGRCCPVSRPAVVHCGGGRLCRGRSLWFPFVAGPLHGDVVRNNPHSHALIDKRTARAARNTRYRYNQIGPLDHKIADNCISLARTNDFPLQ